MNGRIKSAFLFVSSTRFNISNSATIVFPALVGAEYTKFPAIKTSVFLYGNSKLLSRNRVGVLLWLEALTFRQVLSSIPAQVLG